MNRINKVFILSLLRKILATVAVLVIVLVTYEVYHAFAIEHGYYQKIFSSSMIALLVWAVVSAIPLLLYLVLVKKHRLSYIVGLLFVGLVGYNLAFVLKKSGSIDGLVNGFSFMRLVFNVFVIFGLSIYFVSGLQALGKYITTKIFHLKSYRLQELFLSFGVGLVTFLLVVYGITLANILYSIVSWFLALGLGVFVYMQRNSLKQDIALIQETTSSLYYKNIEKNPWTLIAVFLVLCTLIYYFMGFALAYIPYPTAWDASHAYMYYPKIWANNAGYFWSGGPSTVPHLWYAYITFFFSLFGDMFAISADTFAVEMNFLSGLFVLVFGVMLVYQVTQYMSQRMDTTNKDEQDTLKNQRLLSGSVYFGRFFLLLRITSGMGAFLVFVDNKTDLGVMSLTALALLSGFLFIEKAEQQTASVLSVQADMQDKESQTSKKEVYSYVTLSGIFFAAAVLAKPTAMQDVILFAMFLAGTWVGVLLLGGVFLCVIGILASRKQQGFQHFDLQLISGKLFSGGSILSLIALGGSFLTKKSIRGIRTLLRKNLIYIGYSITWVGVFIATLAIARGPWAVVKGIQSNRSLKGIVERTFLAQATNVSGQAEIGSGQSLIDISAITQYNNNLTLAQCEADYADVSLEKLSEDLVKPKGGSLQEDFGRYIWKQGNRQRIFTPPADWTQTQKDTYGSIRLGYGVLHWWFDKPGCYAFDKDAKLLCENKGLFLQNINVQGLRALLAKMSGEGPVYENLKEIITSDAVRTAPAQNQSVLQGQRKEIIDLYQHRVVEVDVKGNIAVPYKYLIPLNIIINWSLQNHSSYYTDIGFIWIIPMLLLVFGWLFSLHRRRYPLFVIHSVALLGWLLFALLTHAIIWYAVGIIIWTILANTLFIRTWYAHAKDEIERAIVGFLVVIIVLWGIMQGVMNFARITTQGMGQQFVWYRSNMGYTDDVQYSPQGVVPKQNVIDANVVGKEVMAWQFGHYNPFINQVKNRNNEDGILVAGTYISYFLDNQNNLRYDGLLVGLAKDFSDGDVCKSYMRLKNKKTRYIIIDPNIVSVASSVKDSLFTRFFADIDLQTLDVLRDGVMTTMVKMMEQGYLNFEYSNNLAYHFILSSSDAQLIEYINTLPDQTAREYLTALASKDLTTTKAMIPLMRFFNPQGSEHVVKLLVHIFKQRILSGEAIQDFAYVLGKDVEVSKIIPVVDKMLTMRYQSDLEQSINQDLTKDERAVLVSYINTRLALQGIGQYAQDSQLIDQQLQATILGTMAGTAQLMIFSLEGESEQENSS